MIFSKFEQKTRPVMKQAGPRGLISTSDEYNPGYNGCGAAVARLLTQRSAPVHLSTRLIFTAMPPGCLLALLLSLAPARPASHSVTRPASRYVDTVRSPDLAARYRTLAAARPRQVRAAPAPVLTVQLAVFTDPPLSTFLLSRYPEDQENIDIIVTEVVHTIIDSVQIYYDHKSLGQKISFDIVKIVISPPELKGSGDIRSYLEQFCAYQRGEQAGLAGVRWDHAVLLTGLDLFSRAGPGRDRGSSGMAFLSGMCSSQASCTIAEARSLGSAALILAHELAHNLGVEHDGEGGAATCADQTAIMGPRLEPGAVRWSPCSAQQMQQFLSRYGGCLQDGAGRGPRGGLRQPPGRVFNGDSQCRVMYGEGWTLHTGPVRGRPARVCSAIWSVKTPLSAFVNTKRNAY